MRIKEQPEDFIVEEITPKGHILEVDKELKWVNSKGEYLVFALQKKNWNTMSAINEIALRAHVSKKRFEFAGTKDRRAITIQRASARNLKKEHLERIKIKDIKLTPLMYSDKPVNLGNLSGNRFTLLVKDIDKMKSPKEKIPNFFGVQRFGERRPITHLVGKALVNEQYKLAVEIYLWENFNTESPEEQEARKRLAKEKDYEQALKYYPKHLKYERTLLGQLAKSPENFVGALNTLPRKLVLMFVHAYQSYLFNKVLQKRLELGFDPMEGDILDGNVPTGPLYGFESKLAEGKQGEIEQETLSSEWLELKDFQLHGMPYLSTRGLRRPLYIELEDFKVLEKGSDWVRVRFSLSKGVYATTVLEFLFRKKRSELLS
ncbi:tRNA pseudouridine(13) synthase TruD [archaeon]|nr:tRNA pseudouridine(13) synthase TruD [archaeon]